MALFEVPFAEDDGGGQNFSRQRSQADSLVENVVYAASSDAGSRLSTAARSRTRDTASSTLTNVVYAAPSNASSASSRADTIWNSVYQAPEQTGVGARRMSIVVGQTDYGEVVTFEKQPTYRLPSTHVVDDVYYASANNDAPDYYAAPSSNGDGDDALYAAATTEMTLGGAAGNIVLNNSVVYKDLEAIVSRDAAVPYATMNPNEPADIGAATLKVRAWDTVQRRPLVSFLSTVFRDICLPSFAVGERRTRSSHCIFYFIFC